MKCGIKSMSSSCETSRLAGVRGRRVQDSEALGAGCLAAELRLFKESLQSGANGWGREGRSGILIKAKRD